MDASVLDLAAYFRRLSWSGEPTATLQTLQSLHAAHLRAIPFENLDAVLGRPPSLRLSDLETKLVRSERGGYCYEHNTLFAAVLETLGLGVTRLAARVLVGAAPGAVRPRTHMALLVSVPGEPFDYLADVGFGDGGALIEAIPLVPGHEYAGAGRRHRLVHEPHQGPLPQWVLQRFEETSGRWRAQYAFTLEPFEAPDFEVINWHMATNPRSPFRKGIYVQRLLERGQLALVGRMFQELRPDGTVGQRELADLDDVLSVLARGFGIVLPEGTSLPLPASADQPSHHLDDRVQAMPSRPVL